MTAKTVHRLCAYTTDDALAQAVRDEAHRQYKSVSELVTDYIVAGLERDEAIAGDNAQLAERA